MYKTLLIAHRGDTVHFPENTIQAFESAFAKGADGIELDVHLHHGKIIVVHDYLFDTSKEYPTLQSILDAFIHSGRIEIEVKSFSSDILSPLSLLLSQYDQSNIELTTSVLPMVHPISEAFPRASIGAIFDDSQFSDWMSDQLIVQKITDLMKLMNANVAHIASLPIERLTKGGVDALHDNTLKVHYHIKKIPMTEQAALYSKLESLGVDQCTFDDIGLVKEVKKEWLH